MVQPRALNIIKPSFASRFSHENVLKTEGLYKMQPRQPVDMNPRHIIPIVWRTKLMQRGSQPYLGRYRRRSKNTVRSMSRFNHNPRCVGDCRWFAFAWNTLLITPELKTTVMKFDRQYAWFTIAKIESSLPPTINRQYPTSQCTQVRIGNDF